MKKNLVSSFLFWYYWKRFISTLKLLGFKNKFSSRLTRLTLIVIYYSFIEIFTLSSDDENDELHKTKKQVNYASKKILDIEPDISWRMTSEQFIKKKIGKFYDLWHCIYNF